MLENKKYGKSVFFYAMSLFENIDFEICCMIIIIPRSTMALKTNVPPGAMFIPKNPFEALALPRYLNKSRCANGVYKNQFALLAIALNNSPKK